jgi:capsular exopolysaccharide synthesis family protein
MPKHASRNRKQRPVIVHENPKSPAAEAYRVLWTNLQFSAVDGTLRKLTVTSAGPGEGKSMTVCNLAAIYAQAGQKTLIIDADMRRPAIHHTFFISNRFGLSHVLSNRCEAHEVISETFVSNLYALPSGVIPPNPAELLASNRMKTLLDELEHDFDVILLDTPPVLSLADAQIVSAQCDGVLLVIDSGRTKIQMVQKAKEKLEMAGARILGAVLNNVKRVDGEYYYYYYYNYGQGK